MDCADDNLLTVNILKSSQLFFKNHQYITSNNISEYLEFTKLKQVFATDEEQANLWEIFSTLSFNKQEINYESCKTGIESLFGPVNKDEEPYTSKEISKIIDRISKLPSKEYKESKEGKEGKEGNVGIIGKDLKVSSIINDLHFSELDNSQWRGTQTNINESNYFGNDNKEDCPNIRSRQSTIIQQLSFENLLQIKKIFCLLEIQNQKEVYISDLQNLLNKYKFIKLTLEDLIYFISMVSNTGLENYEGKITIDFELYTKAVAKIENKCMELGEKTISEKAIKESIDIKENSGEIIDEIINIESNGNGYFLYYETINKRLKSIILEDIFGMLATKLKSSEKTDFYNSLSERLISLNDRVNEQDLYIKTILQDNLKKQQLLKYVKESIINNENQMRSLEEYYQQQQKSNIKNSITNDQFADYNSIYEENNLLSNKVYELETENNNLKSELSLKDTRVFNLQADLEIIKQNITTEKIDKVEYEKIKLSELPIQKKYDELLKNFADYSDKVKVETKLGESELNKSELKSNRLQTNNSSIDTTEKTHKTSESMNEIHLKVENEKLINYTVKLEKELTEREKLIKKKEKKISLLEEEMKKSKLIVLNFNVY